MLKGSFKKDCLEAGLDEAGRGCLAGPVFAAAVILPKDYKNRLLKDSKLLNTRQKEIIRTDVEHNAIAYSVQQVDVEIIDKINILQSSVLAMHRALNLLKQKPAHLIIDGNYFLKYSDIEHITVVKGDNLYLSIAAASVLAKTYRDDWMMQMDKKYPLYDWKRNKGYGTKSHIEAIREHGYSPLHRRSFHIKQLTQYSLPL